MKTVLAPIDFSRVTSQVIEQAVNLAQAVNGSLVVLHVVRPPQVVAGYGGELANVAEVTLTLEEAADEQLAELKKRLEAEGVEARVVRVTGLPVTNILAQADELGADYIVIGSHGHTAMYEFVIGSTASAVIKRATCPVIIVPPSTRPSTPAADVMATSAPAS